MTTTTPRVPLFIRIGDQDEINIGDLYIDSPVVTSDDIAAALRAMADVIEAEHGGTWA